MSGTVLTRPPVDSTSTLYALPPSSSCYTLFPYTSRPLNSPQLLRKRRLLVIIIPIILPKLRTRVLPLPLSGAGSGGRKSCEGR